MKYRMPIAAAAVMAAAAVGLLAPLSGHAPWAQPGFFEAARAQTPAVVAVAPTPAGTEAAFTQPNPRAETGYLANGMRYAVMRRPGVGQVTVMFSVRTGSVNETDDERGVAHYLEHMSVNGSRSFPPGTLVPMLAELGLAFGRDQNASTSYTDTTYRLDISEVTPHKLDVAFQWMADISNGLTIAPSEVASERGVILSEYADTRDPLRDVGERILRFLGPNLRVANRAPIGTRESINAATAASIRGFYERWYRPESSAIIVVGDGEPADFRRRIDAAFAGWRNPRTPTPAPNLGRLDPRRPTDFLAITEAHAPSVVQVCRGRDRDPPQREGVATRTRDFANVIWTSALQDRLGHLAQGANPTFVQGGAGSDDTLESVVFTCLTLSPRAGDWQGALRTAATEMRRLETYGLTAQEYQSQVNQITASLIDGVNSTDTMPAPALADAILFNFNNHGTFSTAAEDRRIGEAALRRLSRDAVRTEFRRVWTQAGQPLIVVVSPTDVPLAQVRRVWTQAYAAAPPPPRDVSTAAWAYTSFGPPGRPVTREAMDNPPFTRIEFANGVRVNFRQTQNAADRVEIRIRFGGGDQELAPADARVARVGASLFPLMGLGRNSYEDIARVCQGRLCDIHLGVDRDTFSLNSTTKPEDLDLDLQLLTAYLTDPGFRPEVNSRIPTEAENIFRVGRTDPNFILTLTRQNAMAAPIAVAYPTQEQMAAMRVEDFRRVLEPSLRNDALEVTIVGDVSEARALQAVAATLGAVPARARTSHIRPNAPVVRFPRPMPPPITVRHDGPPDKAIVSLTWPLFVWTPERSRDSKVIDLLSLLVSDRLTTDIRERLGSSYSPRANISLDPGGDEGSLMVDIQTNPGAAAQVNTEVRRIAAQLAAGDFTAADLERARRPLLDFGASRQLGNEWWVQTLNGSWAHPDQLADANRWSDYSAITLDELRAAARRYLSAEPLTITVLPRTGAPAAAAAPTPAASPATPRPATPRARGRAGRR